MLRVFHVFKPLIFKAFGQAALGAKLLGSLCKEFFSENFKTCLVFQRWCFYLCARFLRQGCQIMFGLLELRRQRLKFKIPFRVMNQKIRIKLRSYDYNLVDKSTEKIVKTVRASGAVVTGPIPLPTEKEIFTVLRSPHVNKKAREQFQLRTHKRLIEIYTPTQKTVDALSKLELPSGVDIQVKLT